MTLHIHADIEQGSAEWEHLRRGMVTASTVGQLVTPSTLKPASNLAARTLAALLVAERVTGWTEPTYMSDDMVRGMEDEPRARDLYAAYYSTPVTELGFMVREGEWGRLGYSPDGLVGDVGLIEVKSRAPKKHVATILADAVPAENMAQVQAGLLVSGRSWLDYISYAGGLPMWTKRVYPDQAWHDAIKGAVAAFEMAAADMEGRYWAAVKGLPETERVERAERFPEAVI
jgi:hypothetical protein